MKKRKKILILIVMCVILLIILAFIYYKINRTKKPLIPEVSPKEDGVLNLSGFSVFFGEKYDGHFKSSQIASKLEDITINVLPELYNAVKEYDDESLEQYFNENADNIKSNFGITDSETFKNMIEKLKKREIDLSTWYRLDLKTETFSNKSNKSDYSYIEYYVSYLNDEKIDFSVYISKKIGVELPFIINVEK